MTDLADRLRAALDAEEKIAQRAARFRWDHPTDAPWERARIIADRVKGFTTHRFTALHTPARSPAAIAAHRQILDNYALVLRQSKENSEKFVQLSRTTDWTDPAWSEQMSNVKTFGWECDGRVTAAKAAVEAIASIYLPDTDQREPR